MDYQDNYFNNAKNSEMLLTQSLKATEKSPQIIMFTQLVLSVS